MSNLTGYCDYNGPSTTVGASEARDNESSTSCCCDDERQSKLLLVNNNNDDDMGNNDDDDNYDDDPPHNPLQVGFWMEGDSLAPPCGTSLSTIHQLLEFAHVQASDVLYDLGCGDGRICFEAWALYHCRAIVGVEIEDDLVAKFERIRSQLLLSHYTIMEAATAAAALPAAVIQDDEEQQQHNKGHHDGEKKNNNSSSRNKRDEGDDDDDKVATRRTTIPAALPQILQQDLRQVLDELVVQQTTGETTLTDKLSTLPVETADSSNTVGSSWHHRRHHQQEHKQQHRPQQLPTPTVIVFYLLPEAILQVQDTLIQLLQHLPNSLRLVCNTWGIPKLQPIRSCEITESGGLSSTTLFLYNHTSVPAVDSLTDVSSQMCWKKE